MVGTIDLLLLRLVRAMGRQEEESGDGSEVPEHVWGKE